MAVLNQLTLPVLNNGTVTDTTYDLPSASINSTGTASASAVRYQRVGINGTYTEIDGTKYMEQTLTTNTNAPTVFTFSNSAITANSVIEGPYASEAGMEYTDLTVTSGKCEVTVNVTTAISLKVRIYIK